MAGDEPGCIRLRGFMESIVGSSSSENEPLEARTRHPPVPALLEISALASKSTNPPAGTSSARFNPGAATRRS
jgi:hypothetical protein